MPSLDARISRPARGPRCWNRSKGDADCRRPGYPSLPPPVERGFGEMSMRLESSPTPGPRSHGSHPVIFCQTLPFTCGPAALLSIVASSGAAGLGPGSELAEIDLWRESTAVACPGAHPMGLALAAERRGFGVHLTWEGPRPWLWSHIRSQHALLPKSDYLRIETSWREECQRHGILTPSRSVPCEGSGLLLVKAGGPNGADRSDPHWVGRWEGPRGAYLLDPLRQKPRPCSSSPGELWSRSGFEGTRCWISMEPKRRPLADRSSSRQADSEESNPRPSRLRTRASRHARPEL
ncbi:MAG: peptidase C39 family protein [Thermoplasmata archaeon]